MWCSIKSTGGRFSATFTITRYDHLFNFLNEDVGWGLHIEGHSTMIGTVLNYVCMCILGEGLDACERGKKWILDHGGAVKTPSWGKTWLAIMGCFGWAGTHPMPPEFWIFPSIMSPAQMFCHCLMTFMPMSYLHGKRSVNPLRGREPLIYHYWLRREATDDACLLG
ncbi:hypothetical protein MLD38_007308 [Melastoma candidum]|uniref:Uncharacterized protein n=1 Tax=Melastoma candidum TaxID=119954 RepID=A0ACB9RRY3_9MYRT|nr:hypothetical protein MLD38_007308 [Melastoma candidum]